MSKNDVAKNQVTKRQMFGHAIGGVGQNLIYGLWSGQMMFFYTDVFGLSASIVGILFFASRVWDAINDPMMGMIADRTNTKWGRFRPWLLFMPIPIGICLVLNFTVPGFTGVGATIYAFVTYILMSMAFTAVDVPYWSLPSVMTVDPHVRTKIFSLSRLTTTLASIAAGALIIPIVTKIGKGDLKVGYQGIAILFAVIGGLLYLCSFANVREHLQSKTDKFSFKSAIQVLAVNKPLLFVLCGSLISSTVMAMRMNLQLYYAQYNLGSLEIAPLLSLSSVPGIVVGAMLAPVLSKKIGKKNSVIYTNILTFILGVVYFIVGYSNLGLVMAMLILLSLPLGIQIVLISSMVADTIEYAEWKTGKRYSGLISSMQTFASKLATAIGAGTVALVLALSGYIPQVAQSQATLKAIHLIMSLVPGVISLVAIIPLFFYTLTEKKHAEIIQELEKRKEQVNAD